MRPFRLEPDGLISVEFSIDEVVILVSLVGQFSQLLQQPGDDDALERLLPDAYPDDEEASAEFRRFTADGLIERKLGAASTVVTSLGSAATDSAAVSTTVDELTELRLDPPSVQAWLVTVGDIRLTIASRLGIRNDGDEGEPGSAITEVYEWLGFVQGTLVDAVDTADRDS